MLRRKVMDTLVEWKNRPHKCMLIKGQRQVGKTFIIRRFAESEYENLIEIDFSKDKSTYLLQQPLRERSYRHEQ